MSEPLRKRITSRFAGRNLPIDLVLPDGGRVPLSTTPEVEVVARNWRGLKALASPALGDLAKAYVHGEVDFSGSARRILHIAESMVGDVNADRRAVVARWRHLMHQRRSNRTNIQYHYDVSNAFYR